MIAKYWKGVHGDIIKLSKSQHEAERITGLPKISKFGIALF
jgi:hypothetical protein